MTSLTDRRMLARASARPRAGSNAQNSQLWSPGGLPPAGVHVYFVGVWQSVWGCRSWTQLDPQLDGAFGLWTASGLRGARTFRRRSSSTHVPDNVPESHMAARPFPGPRSTSWPDVPPASTPATSKALESAWRRSSNETCEQTRPLQFRGADQDVSSPMSSLSSVPAASPSKGDALVGSVGLPVDAAVVDRATD